MTLAVTGDAGKTLVLQGNLGRFGIVQLARTGTVSLKRGQLLLEVQSRHAVTDSKERQNQKHSWHAFECSG